MLVHGEAGIGKSTVVRALRAALPAETRLLTGYCDALSTPRTLGPFKDVAPALGPPVVAALTTGDRDAGMAALHDALAGGVPAVLVVEDVNWADEATLDTLRYLARRIQDLPALVVLTYRDELDRDHPLTLLLGDLGHRSGVLRMPLNRLSPEGVSELAAGGPLDPATVYALTNGNPYLVTELMASTAGSGVTPATVVDGVLGRLRLLSGRTRDAVEQLAVLPGAAARSLVDALRPGAWEHLGEAEARGLLTVTGGVVAFRHELTRRAVADGLSGSRRAEFNRAALRVLEKDPHADLGQLVHHAVEAGDEDAVVRYGPAAAREASGSGSHREAAAHYGTALEYESRFSVAERAALFQAYAVELYTVGDGARCVPAGERAVALWRQVGDPIRLAAGLRWLSRLRWFGGLPDGARGAASEATRVAREGGDESVLAMVLSNESQLAMLGDDNEHCVRLAAQAIEIARRIGDGAVLSHALTNLGSALFHLHGNCPEARGALEEAIAVALAIDDHEDACRAYVNLSWSLLDFCDLEAAEPYARAGVEHAEQAEFVTFWQYLLSLLARIELARARWDEALRMLERVTPDNAPAWCVGLGVRATVAARRGDGHPRALILQGWELAARLDEFQRTVPIACAGLEAAALSGTDPVIDAVPLYRAVRDADGDLLAEELGYRLGAVGCPVADLPPPSAGRTPYALMAAGRWDEAAREWRRLGWRYEEAEALAGSPDVDDQLAALDILDRIGAVPLAQQIRRRLRGLGDVRVPRGPSRDTRADPAGLTPRQQAVLGLLADGLTNSEIAGRMVVSVRTVDSHVAAILDKLGVSSRREAAALQRLRAARTSEA